MSIPDPPAEGASATGERYLEIPTHADATPLANGNQSTAARVAGPPSDPTRIVTALAQDEVPLLAALWPGIDDLARAFPDAAQLDQRITYVNGLLNQVTRRSGEWRARAELAGSALARRLARLRTNDGPGLWPAARDEYLSWLVAGLESRVLAAAGAEGVLYARDARRFEAEADSRGLAPERLAEIYARRHIQIATNDVPVWSELAALPGAPRDMNEVADVLVGAPTEAAVAIRSGAVLAWLKSNRAAPALVAAGERAQLFAQEPERSALAVWIQAWALGRTDVRIGTVTLDSPDALLIALRSGRLAESTVAGDAALLAEYCRRHGLDAAASVCDAFDARPDARIERLLWSLGEPFRVGGRAVADPSSLAREVLQREAARDAALAHFRDGTLLAWLESLPLARRDARWADDLARASETHDELAFYRGVYRHVPRAPLRVSVGAGRYVRFATAADLLSTAQLAAVWEPIKSVLRSGELIAWLEVMAPGIPLEVTRPSHDEDGELNALLWQLGHTGMVLPWGRTGFPIAAPADVMTAYRQSWQKLEAQLARGYVFDYLSRAHGSTRVAGHTLAELLTRIRPADAAWPAGHRALALALACGLEGLPLDPRQPGATHALRGFVGVESARRDASAWNGVEPHARSGTALIWGARVTRSMAPLLDAWLAGDRVEPERVIAVLSEAGAPVASSALIEAQREAERDAQREVERKDAEREAQRLADAAAVAAARAVERDAERLAAEREAERLAAEVRKATALAAERLEAERAAAREVAARIAAEREAQRIAHEREDDRLRALREMERIAAQHEAARAAAEREAERLAAERGKAEEEIAARAREREAAEREAERWMVERASAEREAQRLAGERLEAEREAMRLAAERAAAERLATARVTEAGRLASERVLREDEAHRLADERLLAERLSGSVEVFRDSEGSASETVERVAAERPAAAASPPPGAEETPEPSLSAEDLAGAGLAVYESEREGSSIADLPTTSPAVETSFALPERHDVTGELLLETRPERDAATLARLRAAIDTWSNAFGEHPHRDLGSAMSVDEIRFTPAFSVVVSTRIETRRLESVAAPFPAGEVIHVEGNSEPDLWSLQLPDVDTYADWTACYLLDLPEREPPCEACGARGSTPCSRCDGKGARPCTECNASGRVRCARCAGRGEQGAGRAAQKCSTCEGRGETRCAGCRFGWAECSSCHGAKDVACERCQGRGRRIERSAIAQTYTPAAMMWFVRGGLPGELASDAQHEALGPIPVAHVEAPEVDAFALAREIPNPTLATAIAEMLAQESARLASGARITRQRLIVRRYPAWRVRYHADGEAYELWVHGLRDRVHAQDSPVRRFATTLARDARAALDADRLDACIDALVRLGEIDPESGEGRALSSSVADAVVARARTGAVAEARVLAERAGRLAWPECGARIREAEKRLGQSLAPRSIAERLDLARRSLAEQRFDKAGEHLAAVATLEPTNAQALALLDDALARARERHDRGSPGDLAALTKRLSNTPWSGRIPSARSEATGASRWLAASIVVALLGIALALAGHAHGRIAVTGMVAALEASALVATRRSPNARPAHVSIAALVAWVAVVAWSWHGPG